MKIKTRLTIVLLVSYITVIVIFIAVSVTLFIVNQQNNLEVFKNELLDQNSRFINDSSTLFFKLIDEKLLDEISHNQLIEYIKEIDQLERAVIVFDFNGHSLLKGHSSYQLESLVTKENISRQIQNFKSRNIKNFSIDNYANFRQSSQFITPRKIYLQIYNSIGLIIGYGKNLDEIRTRLEYVERSNDKNQDKFVVSALFIVIIGILFIIIAVYIFTRRTIFEPIGVLIDGFERVANGELFHNISVRSNDEIGRLTHAFNHMTQNLNQSVNEIRAANIKLDSYSRELEVRVKLRTKELSDVVEQLKREIEDRKKIEEELKKSRIEAESANMAKSQFLANMSHEIRTPMNAIIGMSELVMDTPLSSEQEEYISTLKSSAESLLNLLNDILDFSKIEVGKMDIEPIEFHFRESLAEVTKNLAIAAQQKDIELIYDIDFSIPNILIGDPGRLRQILTNLIGNAVKFTNSGIIVLRVKIEGWKPPTNESSAQITLYFTVSDTGIGIPHEKQKMIFEKFYQTDSSITRKFGGSGLGLAISRQLVNLMGGNIWVQSPGELHDQRPDTPGSSFHFTLPFKIARTHHNMCEPIKIKELAQIPVLIVDDNSINRRIYEELLKRWGMEPYLAYDAINALEILQKKAELKFYFKCILIDVQMPVMDGFQLVRHIRENNALMNPHIIILTSAGMKGNGALCKELRVDAYLRKPVPSMELLKTLLLVMGNPPVKPINTPLVTSHNLESISKNIHILVAEDNQVNQKIIGRMLEKRGYLVDIVNNGRESIEKFVGNTYQLILMDIQMPELDGIEATRLIRQREQQYNLPHTPIIALTAHAMKGDRERFLNAGMDSYVSKPIKQQELIRIIEQFLNNNTSNHIEGGLQHEVQETR